MQMPRVVHRKSYLFCGASLLHVPKLRRWEMFQHGPLNHRAPRNASPANAGEAGAASGIGVQAAVRQPHAVPPAGARHGRRSPGKEGGRTGGPCTFLRFFSFVSTHWYHTSREFFSRRGLLAAVAAGRGCFRCRVSSRKTCARKRFRLACAPSPLLWFLVGRAGDAHVIVAR